ncbi:MAG: hypothetical protein ACK2U1_15055, partial [Anaerolineales bacterium]
MSFDTHRAGATAPAPVSPNSNPWSPACPSSRAYLFSIAPSSSFLKSGAGLRSACPGGSSLFAQACTACPEWSRG